MRIAFLVNLFPRLSETFILRQITHLLDCGHQVEIFAGGSPKTGKTHEDVATYNLLARTYHAPSVFALPRTLSEVGFPTCWRNRTSLVKTLDFFRYGKAAAELKLLSSGVLFLNKEPYNALHCHFGGNGIKACALMEIGVVKAHKLITQFHGPDVLNKASAPTRHQYAPLFAKGDLFIVGTEFMAQRIREIGCPAAKISILPVWLDLDRFAFVPRRLVASEPVRLLTVARLVTMKGVEYAIRAAATTAQRGIDLKYVIVGDGPLRGQLQRIISELKMEERIQLLGWRTEEEIQKLYLQAQLYVLPSIVTDSGGTEAQALVLQEAQASGLPVIATNVGGVPEGILNDRSGYLVPQRDVGALAERMQFLIEHSELWPQMGQAGRRFVELNYDGRKLTHRLEQLYQELLNGTSGDAIAKPCDG